MRLEGFFTKQEVKALDVQRAASCVSCGLYKHANSPKMEPFGNFKKRILVIGDFPSKDDDEMGRPWQGEEGKMLRREYRKAGIDLFEDCVTINAVNCYTPNGRDPSGHEINSCRAVRVIVTIEKYKPKVIILHGRSAVMSLIGPRWGSDVGTLARWLGWTIPDRHYNAWLCPTFHPRYVRQQEKMDGETEIRVLWNAHLRKAASLVDTPFPSEATENQVNVTNDTLGTLTRFLDEKPKYLAFDIETTGIKPYDHEKHKIFCIGFSDRPDRAITIPSPKTDEEVRALRLLMRDRRIRKIAANMKFEHTWLSEIYDIEVRGWDFDTMLAAHVLDNRTQQSSGLKFQSYVHFGIVGYDSEVEPYIKADGAYGVNQLESFIRSKEGFNRLATYCGLDAMLTYRLAQIQKEELGL